MKLILLVFLFLTISARTVEELNLLATDDFQNAKQTLDNKVKSYRHTKSYPKNYREYILSWSSTRAEYIFDFMTMATLDKNLPSHHFPQEVVSSIKAAKYLSGSSADSKVSFQIQRSTSEIDEYLGSAMKYKEYILFGVIHTTIRANLVPKYNIISHKECKRMWYCLWICKKCKTVTTQERRGYYASENQIVKQSLQAKSAEEMVNKITHF